MGEKIAAYVSLTFLDAEEPLTRSDAAIRSRELNRDHDVRSAMLEEILQSLFKNLFSCGWLRCRFCCLRPRLASARFAGH